MATYSIVTTNAGHSAKSPGACTKTHREYEQNRLNNKALVKALKARGVTVVDTTSDAASANEILREQVKKANAIGGGAKQLDLSLHLNSSGTGKASGIEVLYVTERGKDVAERIAKAIHEATGLRNRGAKKRGDLYFLNGTVSTANLIEVGFIDSEKDMAVIEKSRDKIADAIATAVTGKKAGAQTSSASTAAKKGASTDSLSVVDYLKSVGLCSTFSNRAYLAVSYGIVKNAEAYTGSAAQNLALLNKLRGN